MTSDVKGLWRHTEGWVGGVRLAAAELRDRADVPGALAGFSGRTAVVADLLADELLHRAPKELSEFLLRTSVADVLDADRGGPREHHLVRRSCTADPPARAVNADRAGPSAGCAARAR